ncbi:hypothetical protein [Nocardioides rubriscoriae]|uniref:hypothetical protein n=1 Tax=Nocardioides rubriscoriae TaxID=642762 RepID=UPI0011DFBBFA|nr:hypothetical protein [Nocardioides rubriscoriae]
MSEYQQERKGFWYEPEGRGTSEAIALETWARVAHPILEETAQGYHAVITESVLAERLKAESGINTARPHDRWLGKVLAPLAHLHHRDGYPPLTALVVDERGWVGERYDDLLRAHDELPITDAAQRERHAARARLECYQWAGSAPEDGGLPAEVVMTTRRAPRAASASLGTPRTPRTPKEPKVAAPKRVAATDRPVTICPRCFMAIPATGLCDNCD